MEQEEKPLSKWVNELKEYGYPHWLRFYEFFLGVGPSNIPRFYKALNLYGFWPMLEAVIDSSTRKLEGDPLAYVLKVAHEKFKADQQQADDDADYQKSIEWAKTTTAEHNRDLAKRLSAKPKGRKKGV